MYVICTYDVNSKRCLKYMKLFRRYLFHVQESVFEDELTPNQYKRLKQEINKLICKDDYVLIYYVYSQKQLKTEEIGKKGKNKVIID